MARNMNGMAIYIPNGRDTPDEPRRSPISSFAANTDTGFFMSTDPDSQLRAGFDGIMANANAQKADRARRGRATLGSMVGHAMDNGGMVPRELGAAYGQELGTNGPAFGTLAKDGTFMSLGVGQDGNVQPTGLVKPFDVMKSMVQSGDWKNAQKYAKKYLDGKYTPEQIAGATGFSPQWARGAATNEIGAADKKLQLEAMKVLLDMDKANKTPVTAEDFYRNNPRLITMLGTDYQRDENGQVVMAENANGVMAPVEITLPPEEISKRAVAFFDGLRKSEANGGGTGMNEIQRAIVDGIRALTTPPAEQQTANVPQRGFYYRNRSGGLTATNGYVVGGKAYDRYGNVMQGVQPLDYQGNPISGDAPDDAVVSTPAPAQQQSQRPTREEIQAELARRRAAKAQQSSAPLSQPVNSLESPAPAQQPKEKSPQDHISLILRDRRLSPKEKEARIAYWRRIQQRNAEKSAEELGVDVNDDLAMLEAELNGPSETMIASN